MTAYLIVHRRKITDADRLKKYGEGVEESIAKFSGRAIVRSDGFEVLEGEWHPGRPNDDSQPERVTVIEFPDMAALKRWYESDDYAELKAIRRASAECEVVAVEGSRQPSPDPVATAATATSALCTMRQAQATRVTQGGGKALNPAHAPNFSVRLRVPCR